MKKEQVINAFDSYPLAASLFIPEREAKGVIIINAAAGVKRQFYDKYALFLSEHGYAVVSYDLRGIGDSRPQKMKGFKAGFEDWADLDFRGIIHWTQQNFPDLPLGFIGHSIGGALLGMFAQNNVFKSVITVATQAAYYKDWAKSHRRKVYFLWHVFMPFINEIWGYFPGRRFNMLEDIPYHIVKVWHLRRKYPNISDQHQAMGKGSYYHQITAPILSIGLMDDPIATEQAITRFHSLFSNAQLEYKFISPDSIQEKEINHFGFFRSRFKDTLWQLTLERFNQTLL